MLQIFHFICPSKYNLLGVVINIIQILTFYRFTADDFSLCCLLSSQWPRHSQASCFLSRLFSLEISSLLVTFCLFYNIQWGNFPPVKLQWKSVCSAACTTEMRTWERGSWRKEGVELNVMHVPPKTERNQKKMKWECHTFYIVYNFNTPLFGCCQFLPSVARFASAWPCWCSSASPWSTLFASTSASPWWPW